MHSIWQDVSMMGIPVAEKALRTVAVYLGILLLLRLAGKRDLAQLNSFDLVVLLLLSNVVQNAIIGNDDSLAGGLLGASILVAGNSFIVRVVRRSDMAVKVFEGTPTTLVRDGKIDHDACRHEGIREEDVVVALRRQGANGVDEVKEAKLEPSGAIVVTLFDKDETASKGDIARLEEKLDRLLGA